MRLLGIFILFIVACSSTQPKIDLLNLKSMVSETAKKTNCPSLDLMSKSYLDIIFGQKGREAKFLAQLDLESEEFIGVIYTVYIPVMLTTLFRSNLTSHFHCV